jgi:Leucine-rich repeat (LRR) protein
MFVKQHYFTPVEAKLDTVVPQYSSSIRHQAIPLNPTISKSLFTGSSLPSTSIAALTKTNQRELDGFYILESAKIDFPEAVQSLSLSGHNLKSVIDEDLTYFTELVTLDVSENNLPFTAFGAIPKLHELKIACNSIQNISDIYGFSFLLYLDVSYNELTIDSVFALTVLPCLKELDLSGNNLSSLPSDLSGFSQLEKISLEYNKYDNNRIFQILGTIKNLRYVNLSHNYLSFIPRECCEYGGFQ